MTVNEKMLIDLYIEKVKSGKITLEEVPLAIRETVNEKVNE